MGTAEQRKTGYKRVLVHIDILINKYIKRIFMLRESSGHMHCLNQEDQNKHKDLVGVRGGIRT